MSIFICFYRAFIFSIKTTQRRFYMKRIFFMFFIFMLFWACTPASDKSPRIIHGIAAIGAYVEEGAQVQVRPASKRELPPSFRNSPNSVPSGATRSTRRSPL